MVTFFHLIAEVKGHFGYKLLKQATQRSLGKITCIGNIILLVSMKCNKLYIRLPNRT